MTFYIITSFITAIACIFLAALVYTKDKKNPTNRFFSFFAIAIFFWSFSYVIWLFQKDPEPALFWSRMLNLGATFIPITYLHWVFVFLKKNKVSRNKKILVFGYILTFIFAFFSFSDIYVTGVAPISNFPYWPQANWLYYIYLAFNYVGMVVYASYLLFRSMKTATGFYKEQIKYVFLGAVIGFVGGATNFPLMLGADLFPPVGNPLVIAYPAFAALAIVKYRLLDIRIILTQFLVGLISLVLFIEAILAETFYQLLYKWALLFLFIYFGYQLIKSVLQEIKRRAELQRLYEEVDKLSKAKSEFISIVSHQLRTPLSVTKGYISMILEGDYEKLPQKIKTPLENIYNSNERLIKLINDLLDVSRIESGKIEMNFEKVSLSKFVEMISSVVDELKIKAKSKNLYLTWQKPATKLSKTYLKLDQNKTRQTILNLVDNAIRYTRRGGITIKVKLLRSAVQVQVKDTGIGMQQEEIASLFKSFTRGAAGSRLSPEGLGLGLYVAKKFVEMHQGKIWAESQGKGKGSTFYIELPLL